MGAERDGGNTTIFAQMWDWYVDDWLRRSEAGQIGGDLAWPGDEWGDPEKWEEIYQTLFVPNDVANWQRAVEIGPGAGKYTARVLTDSATQLRAYDVSERFLHICQRRCNEWLYRDRLKLRLLEGSRANELLTDLDTAGWRRRIDAIFSIDAMVHVDLQYLIVYLITAGLTLKPGGKLILSLADATSDDGFTFMLEQIHWTYATQGKPGGKFEWLSPDLIRSVLGRLGFAVDYLGHSPRDLLLAASLVDPAACERFAHHVRPMD